MFNVCDNISHKESSNALIPQTYFLDLNEYISIFYVISYISDQGHLIIVIENERPVEATARMITSYKNTTGMCLELSYWLKLASLLKVDARGVDHLEQEIERKASMGVCVQQCKVFW